MVYEIVIADPAKNITIFVRNRFDSSTARAEAAKVLLAAPSLKAEQVGFVIPPSRSRPEGASAHWRLEMMGDEFCGNAARSFGLFAAREMGLKGRHTVTIEISGMKQPLPVHVDTDTGKAEVEIPKPLAQTSLEFEGRIFPVFVFDGITHVIAPNLKPDRDTFFAIKGAWHHFTEAFGVMFWDEEAGIMNPAVYVAATDSLVFESSCGSGSAALAVWKTGGGDTFPEGESRYDAAQGGGIIEVQVSRHHGEITGISIGGPVGLSELMRIDVD